MASMPKLPLLVQVAAGLALALNASPASADLSDPCANYSWDVTEERALFAARALAAPGGKDTESAPSLLTDRLYLLHLAPQSSVAFAVAPSKKVPLEAGYAGIASLQVSAPGIYRVSGDSPFWVDAIAAGKTLETKDFQGQKGCSSPHKIVEFELPASVPILLEFSSAGSPDIRVSITAAPLPKS
jgi:hypothetical protein